MEKDVIILLVFIVPLLIFNIVGWTKEIIRWKRHKKTLKELGRWRK